MSATGPRSFTGVMTAEAGMAESVEVTALVDRAKTGDAEAFGDLMRLYEGRIISLGIQMGLSRDDALDACQDSFVKVFRYIRRFHSGRSFFKWLYRISINSIYDQLRKGRRSATVPLEEIEATAAVPLRDGAPPLERSVESADLARKLLAGLGGLSRQERIVFVLRDLQEIGTDEIGRVLRLSPITVRRHCAAARQKLKDRLFPRKS